MRNPSYLDMLAQYGIDSAHPGEMALTKEILKRETINTNTILLDVGCGTGQTSAYIAKKYKCRVFAIDNNQKMLEKAALRFGAENLDVKLFYADAMHLPFTRDSFDIILAESVTIFTTIDKTLKEYSRVLKKGGILIDLEMTAEQPLKENELNDIKSVYSIKQVLSQDVWCKMFRNAGFSNIQVARGSKMTSLGMFPPKLIQDFSSHFNIMSHYQDKLGYRVYRCQF